MCFSKDKKLVASLQAIMGFIPVNINLYKTAFRHRSLFPDISKNNERYEFLGDAVLDLIITDYLMQKYPLKNEGFITKMRAKMVNRNFLNNIGEKLGLPALMEYNKASVNGSGRQHSLVGNTLEALVGAIYIDQGYDRTYKFVIDKILQRYVDLETLEGMIYDHKSRLIEWAQKHHHKIEFRTVKEFTDAKRAKFIMGVFLDGKPVAEGEGFSKKSAEQEASEKFLVTLNKKP